MKAIITNEKGKLSWETVKTPEPSPGEALIRVGAAGVNRADILQRKGLYPPPEGASEILGLEVTGEIIEVNAGPEMTNLDVGDRVMALLEGGGYATHVTVPLAQLLPLPANLNMEEGAAIPEALYTSYFNLIDRASLQKGDRVLIHAGAGGIGTTAIQLANVWEAEVFATTGSSDKAELCCQLGADKTFNYRQKNFEQQIREAASRCDVIFDPVGGKDYTALNIDLLDANGRWLLIGLLGGVKGTLDLGKVLMKNITLMGSTLRDKPSHIKEQLTQHLLEEVLSFYINQQIRPVIDRVYPIQKAREAHDYMRQNKTKGKLVLKVGEV